MNRVPGGPRILLAFIGAGVVWGSGFLLIRIAVTVVSPAQLTLARTAIASLVLALIVVMTRRRWPRTFAAWWRIAVLGVVGCVLPFLLYAYAGQHIESGLSSIYNAGVPVATALLSFAALRGSERPGRTTLAGIALGAVGLVIVLAPWQWRGTGGLDLASQIACIAAVLFLGFAFVWTRKAITPLGLDPVAVACGQMIAATLAQLLIAPWTIASPLAGRLDGLVVLCIVLLGAFSTGIAYAWNFRVIEAWGASSASMVTYLTTLTGVILGVLVLGETFTWAQLLGGAVVLAGVALGVSRRGVAAPVRGG